MHPAAIIGIVVVVSVIIGVLAYMYLSNGSSESPYSPAPTLAPDATRETEVTAQFTSDIPSNISKLKNPIRQINLGHFIFKY
jgi:hypothetical protein